MKKESPLRTDSFSQMLKKVQDEHMVTIKFEHIPAPNTYT